MTPASGGDDPRKPDDDGALSTERRRWLSAAAVAALLPTWASERVHAASPPAAEATPGTAPPSLMATLFAQRTIWQASLSSDGRYLAMIGSSRGRPVALIQDLTTQQTQVLMDSYFGLREYRDVVSLRWVKPDMVVMVLGRGTSLAFDPQGKLILRMAGFYVDRLPDGDQGEPRALLLAAEAMHVVDLRDGRWYVRPHDLPEEEAIVHFAFDAQGRLRAATTLESSRWSGKTVWTQWYRGAEPKAPWRQLMQSQGDEEIWRPMRVLPDGHMAILARAGRDARAVFRYDPEQCRIGEMMAGHETDDVIASGNEDAATFDFVITGGLRRKVFWFDEGWGRLQKAVDQALPDTVNLLSGEDSGGHVLVYSYSDVDPGRWHALDTQAKRIKEIAVAMPDIDPARMRPMQAYRYPARDGLSVPAYLTRPAAPGPAPTVVVIHGGPQARDAWGWDAEVQLLAAQGYAVFQPQFRGSTGFGLAYERAGYRQWGESMQDDITDGVQDLIDRGIADPARVAIFGASYGGYAAMWGLVKTPKLYRCGISFAGISDLDDFVRTTWWDDSTAASRLWRRRLVGDPSTAQAQLRAVSPIRHIDRIEVPLLLVHGTEDKRVLPGQSERMVDAMKARGKRVEWMLLETGHGFDAPDSKLKIQYFEKVLSFLAEHLGPTTATAAATSTASTP